MACDRRFVIGRERPGQQSEVAALIQQTLEQERRQRELLEQQYAHYDADDDEVTSRHRPWLVCSWSPLAVLSTHTLEVGKEASDRQFMEISCHFLTVDLQVLAF